MLTECTGRLITHADGSIWCSACKIQTHPPGTVEGSHAGPFPGEGLSKEDLREAGWVSCPSCKHWHDTEAGAQCPCSGEECTTAHVNSDGWSVLQ
jgi:hypothetical protein